MIILPYSDNAMLINFEQEINQKINQRVIALHRQVSQIKAVTDTIPAYCSLTIIFEPDLISFKALKQEVLNLTQKDNKQTDKGLTYTIPVCYDEPYAPDMEEVCAITGLRPDEIVTAHTNESYQVYMLGFVAGFAYLGSLPKKLQVSRKATPRKKVPAGSVGLAGVQTGIYPTEAPGGWQLIGQTPVKTFDPKLENPVLLKPGDRVQFRAIDQVEFETIADSVKFGTYKPEVSHG